MNSIHHIHIPKTGGSWLRKVLSKYVSNYSDWGQIGYEAAGLTSADKSEKYRSGKVVLGTPPRRNQFDQPPEFSKEWWETPKVSICRNPFDYLVSIYHHERNESAHLMKKFRNVKNVPAGFADINVMHGFTSFEDFIKKFCDPDFPFTSRLGDIRYMMFNQMFHWGGTCGIDYIIRNESLPSGTFKVLKQIGAFENISQENAALAEINGLGRINVSRKRKKKDYRSYYTDELRELVEVKCDAELTLFEYDFDGPCPNQVTRGMYNFNDTDFVCPKSLWYSHEQPSAVKNMPAGSGAVASAYQAVKRQQLLLKGFYEYRKQQSEDCQSIYPDVFEFEGMNAENIAHLTKDFPAASTTHAHLKHAQFGLLWHSNNALGSKNVFESIPPHYAAIYTTSAWVRKSYYSEDPKRRIEFGAPDKLGSDDTLHFIRPTDFQKHFWSEDGASFHPGSEGYEPDLEVYIQAYYKQFGEYPWDEHHRAKGIKLNAIHR
ncbi:MAG: sulfotransferase family 2 domain-containing protein [Candidatus Latescibacterota bacterium]|nr:sulfotransferase family 2 domain-containing protein [Candidatus Latescibacterota bacterium]